MPIDRERHLGEVSEARVVEVEKGALRFFAKATGEDNPIYSDEAAALAAGHPGILAPPTYLFSLFMGAPAKIGDIFDAENGLGLDTSRILHGEQGFVHHHPIHAGDRLSLTTTTSDIYSKRGGALEFVVQDTQAVDEDGRLVAEMRSVTVVRND